MSDYQDYIEVSVMVANLNKNKNCPITNWEREVEIANFFRNLSPKPDLFLLQEAYLRFDSRIDQIGTVMNSLSESGNWEIDQKEEFARNYFKKFNAIINNRNRLRFETDRFSFNLDIDERRFYASKFSIGDKTLLVVSFHAFNNKNMLQKELDLEKYLQTFADLKTQTGSSHLLIGGDFNYDLDYLERRFSRLLYELDLDILPIEINETEGK